MNIICPAFLEGEKIPDIYAYNGGNLSPPLKFYSVPSQTKELLLIVHDPDAPVGDFLHWIAWNIDPKLAGIEQNNLPVGTVQGKNDFGNKKWDGPSPPSGTHRYIFDLYALDIKLLLDDDTSRQQLEKVIKIHIIDSAKLIGLYSK